MAYKVNIGATEMSGNLTVNSDYAYYGDGSNLSGISTSTITTVTKTAAGSYYVPFVDTATGESGETIFIHDVIGLNPGTDAVTLQGALTIGGALAGGTSYSGSAGLSGSSLVLGQGNVMLSRDGTIGSAGAAVLDTGGVGSSFAGELDIGGGFGSTGITLSAAGVITANGSISSSVGLSGSSLVLGQGNVMLSRDGTIGSAGAAVLDTGGVGSSFAGALDIGGGYGSTGITLSTAGVITANGAISSSAGLSGSALIIGHNSLTTNRSTIGVNGECALDVGAKGSSFGGALTIGGGFGSTGITLSTAGVITANGSISSSVGLSGSSLVIGQGNVMLSRDGTVDISGDLNAEGILAINNGVRYGSLDVKTSAATLTSANSIIVASGSSAFNITLPGNPTEGEFFMIKRHANMSGGDVTILSASAANGASIDGDSSVVLETVGAAVSLVYDDTTDSWNVF